MPQASNHRGRCEGQPQADNLHDHKQEDDHSRFKLGMSMVYFVFLRLGWLLSSMKANGVDQSSQKCCQRKDKPKDQGRKKTRSEVKLRLLLCLEDVVRSGRLCKTRVTNRERIRIVRLGRLRYRQKASESYVVASHSGAVRLDCV